MPEWKGRVPLTRSHCERITRLPPRRTNRNKIDTNKGGTECVQQWDSHRGYREQKRPGRRPCAGAAAPHTWRAHTPRSRNTQSKQRGMFTTNEANTWPGL
ncbi:hypothetical protein EVAR_19381_1 [Eumeta japonica]|uniref:Uncharacterized protein n=1 Tax=Eumeta variegata TaxID=151549 RepID=A0A4C1TRS1_EUMVA|nr:hypothetical protein EVAR_19381_1 [Eumeta japonica]